MVCNYDTYFIITLYCFMFLLFINCIMLFSVDLVLFFAIHVLLFDLVLCYKISLYYKHTVFEY